MRSIDLLFMTIFIGASCMGVAVTAETPLTSAQETTPVEEKMTQILLMHDQKRLEANIGANVMNRISVLNDRIINVFGEEGTFMIQTEENTGQIFIKPTLENQTKALSISIITENGITQDLLLHPAQTKASTLILKPHYKKSSLETVPASILGEKHRGNNTQEQWIQALRRAVLGELPKLGAITVASRKQSGLRLKHIGRYQAENLLVDRFSVHNLTKTTQQLSEKQFYQQGDLAILLTQLVLPAKGNVEVYILLGG